METDLLSPTVLAGIQVLNSFSATRHAFSEPTNSHHHIPVGALVKAGGMSMGPGDDSEGETEDLILRYRILESKALEDRRAKQRAEDELKFAKHKVSERDKQLDQQRQQLSKQQGEIWILQKKLDDRDAQCATMKQQTELLLSQLDVARRELAKCQETLQSQRVSPTDKTSFVAGTADKRRGSVTQLINEKAKSLGLQRRLKAMQLAREQASQAMESDLMYEADLHSALTQRNLARGITPINDLLRAEAKGEDGEEGQTKKVSGLVSYEGIRRYGRGTVHLTFNEPLDLRTPHDAYIDAKMKASPFRDELIQFKEAVSRCAKDLKSVSDTTLSSLWFIFGEKSKGARGGCILQNPQEDFQKEVKHALLKSKTTVLELMRVFTENLKNLMMNERRVKDMWLKEQRPSADFAIQVEIPPPEDPRIAILSEEISFLKLRQTQMYEEHNKQCAELEMQREKAEVNTQFLQQKVFGLHSAVHTALNSVYKHRFKWGPRCPNHFAPLEKNASKKRQLEVGYNIQLGEAIDMEVRSLGAFADYFVSDLKFGLDLSVNAAAVSGPTAQPSQCSFEPSPFGKENDVGVVMRKKEAVPLKKSKVDQARRLSSQLDSILKMEIAEKKSAQTSDSDPAVSEVVVEVPKVKPQGPRPLPMTGIRQTASVGSRTPPPSLDEGIEIAAEVNLADEPAGLHRAETFGPNHTTLSKGNPSANSRPRRASVGISGSSSRTKSSSPRNNQQLSNPPPAPNPPYKSVVGHVDVGSFVPSAAPTIQQQAKQFAVRPLPPSAAGSSPVTTSMVVSLIPTTINLELDPNTVSFAYQHRPSPTSGNARHYYGGNRASVSGGKSHQ